MRPAFAGRGGFSLLELLVTVAILGILVGLTLSAVHSVRATAARADCQSRMRQLSLATQSHHALHRQFPVGVAYPFSRSDLEAQNRHAGLSWQTSLLPQVEQDALWRQAWAAHTAKPNGNSTDHDAVAAVSVKAFRCPSDTRDRGAYNWTGPENEGHPGWGLTNYVGVSGTDIKSDDGIFHPNLRVNTSGVTDGTSNTLLIGERPTGPDGYGNSWYSGWGTLRYFQGQLMPVSEEWANGRVDGEPCPDTRTVFQVGKYESRCDQKHFWSLHPSGANFAFADGSVRFLSYYAAPLLPALATRAGNEPAVLPD